MLSYKCPFLRVVPSELEKVKPEFRSQVKVDAEKCIEDECFSFVNKTCIRQSNLVHEIKIGGEPTRGTYLPNIEMMLNVGDL